MESVDKTLIDIDNSDQKNNSNSSQTQYDELIRIIRIRVNSRAQLIEWINKTLKLKIPKSTNYQNLIEQIINSGNETKFSQKMYGLSSFGEIIEKDLIEDGLHAFSKETWVVIAKNLSQNKKKWKFTKSNAGDLKRTLVFHTSLKDYEKLLPELIQNEQIPNLIQHHRAVVGSLGITRSVVEI